VDEEQIITRLAALDIGQAELACCVRVPAEGGSKQRVQEISTNTTMIRSLAEPAKRLVDLRVERIVMEATSDTGSRYDLKIILGKVRPSTFTRTRVIQSGGRGESHPSAPAEPCVTDIPS